MKYLTGILFSIAVLMSAGLSAEQSKAVGGSQNEVSAANRLYEKSSSEFNQVMRDISYLARDVVNDSEMKKKYPEVVEKAAVIIAWQNPFICPAI